MYSRSGGVILFTCMCIVTAHTFFYYNAILMQPGNIGRYTQLKIGKKILPQIFLDIMNILKYWEIDF